MNGLLYKITNVTNGKILVGAFTGTFDQLVAQIQTQAAGKGNFSLTIEQIAPSVRPARSERSFRAQSYLNGIVYLQSQNFASLFTNDPMPVAPPVSTIPAPVHFTSGDQLTLLFKGTLHVEPPAEIDSLDGTLQQVPA